MIPDGGALARAGKAPQICDSGPSDAATGVKAGVLRLGWFGCLKIDLQDLLCSSLCLADRHFGSRGNKH